MDIYNSKAASRIVGVSLRQIQYWDERGFIRPSVKLAHGRGSKRLYSFGDLLCLKVMKDLTGRGLSLRKIRRCLRPLRRFTARSGGALESAKYLTDGEKLFVITSDRQEILDAMEREFVFSLGIGNLVRRLNSDLARSAARAARTAALQGCAEKKSGSA